MLVDEGLLGVIDDSLVVAGESVQEELAVGERREGLAFFAGVEEANCFLDCGLFGALGHYADVVVDLNQALVFFWGMADGVI